MRPRHAGVAGLTSLLLAGAPALAGRDERSVDAAPAAVRVVPGEATIAGSTPARSQRPPAPRFLFARVRPGASVTLRSRPSGATIATLTDRTEFGSPHVLGVVRRRGGWLGVTIPDRPNGTLAWVRADQRLALRRTRVSVSVDLSGRRLAVRRGRRVVARATVAVGMPVSPTPTGRFAVTDRLSGPRFSETYGCCILALSGTQPNPPPGWSGGNRLAIHGTYGPVGTPSSAGCVRAANGDMQRLMSLVPAGAPVFIKA